MNGHSSPQAEEEQVGVVTTSASQREHLGRIVASAGENSGCTSLDATDFKIKGLQRQTHQKCPDGLSSHLGGQTDPAAKADTHDYDGDNHLDI